LRKKINTRVLYLERYLTDCLLSKKVYGKGLYSGPLGVIWTLYSTNRIGRKLRDSAKEGEYYVEIINSDTKKGLPGSRNITTSDIQRHINTTKDECMISKDKSFITGLAGTYFMDSVFLNTKGTFDNYISICHQAIDDQNTESDWFTGLAGYLSSLYMYKQIIVKDLQQKNLSQKIRNILRQRVEILREVSLRISWKLLETGRETASKTRVTNLPLLWAHKNEVFIGVRLGLMGILNSLLLAAKAFDFTEVLPVVEDAIFQFYDNRDSYIVEGNYVDSIGLIQDAEDVDDFAWTEKALPTNTATYGYSELNFEVGNGGALLFWTNCFTITKKEEYGYHCKMLGETISEYGVVKSGRGFGTGVAGNAAAIMRLAESTIDSNAELWNAVKKFINVLTNEKTDQLFYPEEKQVPGLFNGMSGTFILLNHLEAKVDPILDRWGLMTKELDFQDNRKDIPKFTKVIRAKLLPLIRLGSNDGYVEYGHIPKLHGKEKLDHTTCLIPFFDHDMTYEFGSLGEHDANHFLTKNIELTERPLPKNIYDELDKLILHKKEKKIGQEKKDMIAKNRKLRKAIKHQKKSKKKADHSGSISADLDADFVSGESSVSMSISHEDDSNPNNSSFNEISNSFNEEESIDIDFKSNSDLRRSNTDLDDKSNSDLRRSNTDLDDDVTNTNFKSASEENYEGGDFPNQSTSFN